MIKRILLIAIFFFLFLMNIYSDYYYELPAGTELNRDTKAGTEKDITMNIQNINYFEAGFLSDEYSGTGSLPLSNGDVILIPDDNGAASGAVYVYWAYATDDKFSMELSIDGPMRIEGDETSSEINWEVSNDNQNIKITDSTPHTWSFNDKDDLFHSTIEKGILLNIKTTESFIGKKVGDYTGYLTLTIKPEGGSN